MQLFDVVPDKFFSILSSRNKVLYVDALFVIRGAFKNEELTISREQVFSALCDHLRFQLPTADFSEEDAALGYAVEGVNGKVNAIISRLKECGWIDFEYTNSTSLDENVTIPDYAIAVINVLYDLTQERKQEYRGYIFASYATLKIADDSQNDYYNALSIAHENTMEYLEALKVLYNNIRRYIQRSASLGVNDLLSEHFDKYSVKITKALLDPIKTTDSVQRYKFHILSILRSWQESEEILSKILQESKSASGEVDEEEKKSQILSMMDFIIDTYESVERTISKIDERHRQYMHLSLDSIRYKMSSGVGTTSLITKLLSSPIATSAFREKLVTSFDLSEYPFVSTDSLYCRVARNTDSDGSGEAVVQYQEDTSVVSAFLAELENQYGSDRVDRFVLSAMQGKSEITSHDFSLLTNEDFILFLFATLRSGDVHCPYEVTFSDGEDEVQVMGYQVPMAVFRRKEDRDGV